MAEGGYDPETTFPGGDNEGYDPHDDKTPLIPGEEVGMKHWTDKDHQFPSITKSSSSKKQETSFMGGNTDGKDALEQRIRDKEELEKDILKVYPSINKKLLPFIRRDDYGQMIVNLGKKNSKDWVIAYDGSPGHDVGLAKFPKGLRDGLGKTNVQINQENYDKQIKKRARTSKERTRTRRSKKGKSCKCGRITRF